LTREFARSILERAVYTLDSAGNRTAKTDKLAGVTSNYSYDSIYELTQVLQGTTTTESYSYDPVGNRTASLGVASYTTNSSNEMTANSNASYTYDANGNTLTKVVGSNTTSYAWDYENRLTTVTLPNSGGTVTFEYDPFGRRIEKISPSATSIFLYDGDKLVETANASGGEVASYAHGNDIDEPLAMDRSGTVDYYEADGLGSVTSLAASNGTIAQSYTYDSFGNLTNSSGSLTNYLRYTGREFDTETGLYYYRARYYDPTAARFASEDPFKLVTEPTFYSGQELGQIETQLYKLHYYDPTLQEFISLDPAGLISGVNFYEYAHGNPTDLTDPFGLWTGQLGIGISLNVPIFGPVGVGGSAFGGIAYDGTHWALYWGGGLGPGVGAGVSGGVTIGGSNARNVCGLRGLFGNIGGSGGAGWGGGAEGFAGKDSQGNTVLGGNAMIGGAAGGSGTIQGTYTWVHPFGGCQCPN
jgi:RHS repeat-associated protein